MLTISEHEIRRHGPGRLLTVCWRKLRAESDLARRGIRYRGTALPTVIAAYAAMSPAEFDAINGPQSWANWRTIPRALTGHVPDRPLRVLDLGCGSGSSTRVLAFYCPAGSRITGYEIAEPMLAYARRREYRQHDGGLASVDFICQGMTEKLREPADSVDLINTSGVIGHHLRAETFAPLLAELMRVLKSDGVAMLDAGPTMPADTLRRLMSDANFECLGHFRSWFGDRTGQLVFRRAQ